MPSIKNKQKFGTWWVERTKQGKFALLDSEKIAEENTQFDLSEEQLKKLNIELFQTRKEAEQERIIRIVKTLNL